MAVLKDLMLVGSVPCATVRDVFEVCGETVGDMVSFLPDGEIGDRLSWVNYLCYRVFNGHPAIETVRRPAPIAGTPQWKPTDMTNNWVFQLRNRTDELKFLELGYADFAIGSYSVFTLLRDAGRIPADVKFMVCLPLTNSAIDTFFHDPEDYPVLHAAYEDVMERELQRMFENIPTDDLVIQWDVCIEVLDIEGRLPWTPKGNELERNTQAIANLSPTIPKEVTLGYHWCYGTLGGWPMSRPKDLAVCVDLSHASLQKSGRRVDFLHMPVPRNCEEAYFAPLRGLVSGDTKIYLGTIHETDDVSTNVQRAVTARQYLPGCGLSSVCGYGRRSADDVRWIMERHRDVLHAVTRQLG